MPTKAIHLPSGEIRGDETSLILVVNLNAFGLLISTDHKSSSATNTIVELLIVKGAEINATDGEGQTPLDWSKQQFSNDDISNLLRKHGGKTGEELKAEGK